MVFENVTKQLPKFITSLVCLNLLLIRKLNLLFFQCFWYQERTLISSFDRLCIIKYLCIRVYTISAKFGYV